MVFIVVEADGSSVVCFIKMTLMAALPGFCLNKKQKIHDVSGIFMSLFRCDSYKKILINNNKQQNHNF